MCCATLSTGEPDLASCIYTSIYLSDQTNTVRALVLSDRARGERLVENARQEKDRGGTKINNYEYVQVTCTVSRIHR
jgi:hypothetical protein